MLKLVHSMLPAILIAISISPIALSQDRSTAVEAIQSESDAMRKELIQRYRTSPLFGELLSKNSKIKGAARRLEEKLNDGTDWLSETQQLDQLLFDLEAKIEEANFQASIEESKPVSLRLGGMIANVELLKNGTGKSDDVPKSMDYLPKTDLDPITPATNDPGALNSPLIMGPEGAPESPLSVLELPQITVDEDPGALVLPDLTMPTPENTVAGDNPYRQTLKPQLNDQTGNQFELQPLDNRNPPQARIPRMQAPQALPYGGSYIPSPTRRLSVPIQVEFFSISRGYIPYGGYRSRGYSGYRPYGGGYGGGRYCPYGR